MIIELGTGMDGIMLEDWVLGLGIGRCYVVGAE